MENRALQAVDGLGNDARRLEAEEREIARVEKPTFWSRVGHWLRSSGELDGTVSRSESEQRRPAESTATEQSSSVSTETPVSGDGAKEGAASAMRLRTGRHGLDLARLEEQQARAAELMEAIRDHLASQNEQSKQIGVSLEELAKHVALLSDASGSQLDQFHRINEEVTVGGACAKRIEQSLSQLPQIADAQRETMVSIGRQLDVLRDTSSGVAKTLEGFGEAVSRLSEAGGASAEVLKSLRTDSAARGERIAALIEEQTKRLTVFASVAIAVAAIAAVLGLVALFR